MKIQIKTLLKTEFRQHYIGKTLNVSKTWQRNENKIDQRLRKVSTITDHRNSLRLCKQDRTKTSYKLIFEFVLSNGKQFSDRTIRRRLLDMT